MKLFSATARCAAMLFLLGACADTDPAEENDNPEANARPIPTCGDEKTESGEDCDDGKNGDDDDGCTDECVFSCVKNLDCDDLDACNGGEICDAELHRCVSGTPITCDDANFCTEDICHPSSDNTYDCSNDLIDEDGDGFAAGDCPEESTPGGDCDDHNNRVRPDQEAHYLLGYGEYLDNFDYNCDGEETWDKDTVCSSADCCEFWQDSFMNSDFEFPACGSSAERMSVCLGTSSYSQIARPCH